MPPYYNLGYGIALDAKSGGNVSIPGSAGPPTGAPTSGAGGETGSGAGATTGSGTGGVTGEAPTGSNAHAIDSNSSNDSGGCQMGTGHTSSNASILLGLMGFLGLVRRRRAS
jgi:MYXO-CTERM domain-containing protein